jgi:ribosome-associated toxin RatA of RatAB toxin-antitoxin module
MAIVLTVLFANPGLLISSSPIMLTENERKSVEQGDIVVREIETGNKPGQTFEAVGLVNTHSNNIIQVLTEYEKYPEFMPNVSHVEIVERSEGEAVLNFTLALPLGKTKKYRLRITLAEHGRKASTIKWKMLKWPGLKDKETIKDTVGYWRIEEKSENSSLLFYHVYTDPGPVPLGTGWIVDILSKKSVPKALLQAKETAEKIAQ